MSRAGYAPSPQLLQAAQQDKNMKSKAKSELRQRKEKERLDAYPTGFDNSTKQKHLEQRQQLNPNTNDADDEGGDPQQRYLIKDLSNPEVMENRRSGRPIHEGQEATTVRVRAKRNHRYHQALKAEERQRQKQPALQAAHPGLGDPYGIGSKKGQPQHDDVILRMIRLHEADVEATKMSRQQRAVAAAAAQEQHQQQHQQQQQVSLPPISKQLSSPSSTVEDDSTLLSTVREGPELNLPSLMGGGGREREKAVTPPPTLLPIHMTRDPPPQRSQSSLAITTTCRGLDHAYGGVQYGAAGGAAPSGVRGSCSAGSPMKVSRGTAELFKRHKPNFAVNEEEQLRDLFSVTNVHKLQGQRFDQFSQASISEDKRHMLWTEVQRMKELEAKETTVTKSVMTSLLAKKFGGVATPGEMRKLEGGFFDDSSESEPDFLYGAGMNGVEVHSKSGRSFRRKHNAEVVPVPKRSSGFGPDFGMGLTDATALKNADSHSGFFDPDGSDDKDPEQRAFDIRLSFPTTTAYMETFGLSGSRARRALNSGQGSRGAPLAPPKMQGPLALPQPMPLNADDLLRQTTDDGARSLLMPVLSSSPCSTSAIPTPTAASDHMMMQLSATLTPTGRAEEGSIMQPASLSGSLMASPKAVLTRRLNPEALLQRLKAEKEKASAAKAELKAMKKSIRLGQQPPSPTKARPAKETEKAEKEEKEKAEKEEKEKIVSGGIISMKQSETAEDRRAEEIEVDETTGLPTKFIRFGHNAVENNLRKKLMKKMSIAVRKRLELKHAEEETRELMELAQRTCYLLEVQCAPGKEPDSASLSTLLEHHAKVLTLTVKEHRGNSQFVELLSEPKASLEETKKALHTLLYNANTYRHPDVCRAFIVEDFDEPLKMMQESPRLYDDERAVKKEDWMEVKQEVMLAAPKRASIVGASGRRRRSSAYPNGKTTKDMLKQYTFKTNSATFNAQQEAVNKMEMLQQKQREAAAAVGQLSADTSSEEGDDDDSDKDLEKDGDGEESSVESSDDDSSDDDELANRALTSDGRLDALFRKFNVLLRPDREFNPFSHDEMHDAAKKCATCVFARPMVLCRTCGFMFCRTCNTYVHNDLHEVKPHVVQSIAKAMKQAAKERFEKAMVEEREAQRQREMEEQVALEEAQRRNQKAAFANMMDQMERREEAQAWKDEVAMQNALQNSIMGLAAGASQNQQNAADYFSNVSNGGLGGGGAGFNPNATLGAQSKTSAGGGGITETSKYSSNNLLLGVPKRGDAPKSARGKDRKGVRRERGLSQSPDQGGWSDGGDSRPSRAGSESHLLLHLCEGDGDGSQGTYDTNSQTSSGGVGGKPTKSTNPKKQQSTKGKPQVTVDTDAKDGDGVLARSVGALTTSQVLDGATIKSTGKDTGQGKLAQMLAAEPEDEVALSEEEQWFLPFKKAAKSALIIAVPSFGDVSVAPLPQAMEKAAMLAEMLARIGYQVDILSERHQHDWLHPTADNIHQVIKMACENMEGHGKASERKPQALMIIFLTRGSVGTLSDRMGKQRIALTCDSVISKLSSKNCILPSELAAAYMMKEGNNAPLYVVDAWPVLAAPFALDQPALGFSAIVGGNPNHSLTCVYPKHQSGWLTYYLERALQGRMAYGTGTTTVGSSELVTFIGGKLRAKNCLLQMILDPTAQAALNSERVLASKQKQPLKPGGRKLATVATNDGQIGKNDLPYFVFKQKDLDKKKFKAEEIKQKVRIHMTLRVRHGANIPPHPYTDKEDHWVGGIMKLIQRIMEGQKKRLPGETSLKLANVHHSDKNVFIEFPDCHLMFGVDGKARKDKADKTVWNVLAEVRKRCEMDRYCFFKNHAGSGVVEIQTPNALANQFCLALFDPELNPTLPVNPRSVQTTVILTVVGTRRDYRRLQKMQSTQPIFNNSIITRVELDPRPERHHIAALKIQRRLRGYFVRARLAEFDVIREEEALERNHMEHQEVARMGAIRREYFDQAAENLYEEEDKARDMIIRLELRKRHEKADVQGLECMGREAMMRSRCQDQEAYTRLSHLETFNRNIMIHIIQRKLEILMRFHKTWFRCHWMQYYIELEEYRARLNLVSIGRKILPAKGSGDYMSDMRKPPTDFDFASSMVAFPKEFRRLRNSMKQQFDRTY